MNPLSTSRVARQLVLMCALLPAALVGGCGGSNSGPTARPTPTPSVVPGMAFRTSAFRLDNGQIGLLTLNFTGTGNSIVGNLHFVDASSSNPAIAAADYQVSGTLAAPSAFSVTGNTAVDGPFTLSGVLPSNSTDGSYNFTFKNISRTGRLSANGLASVPASTSYRATGALTFTDFASRGPAGVEALYPFDFAPVTPSGSGAFNGAYITTINEGNFSYSIRDNSILPGLTVSGTRINPLNARDDLKLRITIVPISYSNTIGAPLVAGQRFDLRNLPNSNLGYSADVALTLNGYDYFATSGSLLIRSIGPESVSLELSDVAVANSNSYPTDPNLFPNDGQPISTLKINGTLSATGLQTQISP